MHGAAAGLFLLGENVEPRTLAEVILRDPRRALTDMIVLDLCVVFDNRGSRQPFNPVARAVLSSLAVLLGRPVEALIHSAAGVADAWGRLASLSDVTIHPRGRSDPLAIDDAAWPGPGDGVYRIKATPSGQVGPPTFFARALPLGTQAVSSLPAGTLIEYDPVEPAPRLLPRPVAPGYKAAPADRWAVQELLNVPTYQHELDFLRLAGVVPEGTGGYDAAEWVALRVVLAPGSQVMARALTGSEVDWGVVRAAVSGLRLLDQPPDGQVFAVLSPRDGQSVDDAVAEFLRQPLVPAYTSRPPARPGQVVVAVPAHRAWLLGRVRDDVEAVVAPRPQMTIVGRTASPTTGETLVVLDDDPGLPDPPPPQDPARRRPLVEGVQKGAWYFGSDPDTDAEYDTVQVLPELQGLYQVVGHSRPDGRRVWLGPVELDHADLVERVRSDTQWDGASPLAFVISALAAIGPQLLAGFRVDLLLAEGLVTHTTSGVIFTWRVGFDQDGIPRVEAANWLWYQADGSPPVALGHDYMHAIGQMMAGRAYQAVWEPGDAATDYTWGGEGLFAYHRPLPNGSGQVFYGPPYQGDEEAEQQIVWSANVRPGYYVVQLLASGDLLFPAALTGDLTDLPDLDDLDDEGPLAELVEAVLADPAWRGRTVVLIARNEFDSAGDRQPFTPLAELLADRLLHRTGSEVPVIAGTYGTPNRAGRPDASSSRPATWPAPTDRFHRHHPRLPGHRRLPAEPVEVTSFLDTPPDQPTQPDQPAEPVEPARHRSPSDLPWPPTFGYRATTTDLFATRTGLPGGAIRALEQELVRAGYDLHLPPDAVLAVVALRAVLTTPQDTQAQGTADIIQQAMGESIVDRSVVRTAVGHLHDAAIPDHPVYVTVDVQPDQTPEQALADLLARPLLPATLTPPAADGTPRLVVQVPAGHARLIDQRIAGVPAAVIPGTNLRIAAQLTEAGQTVVTLTEHYIETVVGGVDWLADPDAANDPERRAFTESLTRLLGQQPTDGRDLLIVGSAGPLPEGVLDQVAGLPPERLARARLVFAAALSPADQRRVLDMVQDRRVEAVFTDGEIVESPRGMLSSSQPWQFAKPDEPQPYELAYVYPSPAWDESLSRHVLPTGAMRVGGAVLLRPPGAPPLTPEQRLALHRRVPADPERLTIVAAGWGADDVEDLADAVREVLAMAGVPLGGEVRMIVDATLAGTLAENLGVTLQATRDGFDLDRDRAQLWRSNLEDGELVWTAPPETWEEHQPSDEPGVDLTARLANIFQDAQTVTGGVVFAESGSDDSTALSELVQAVAAAIGPQVFLVGTTVAENGVNFRVGDGIDGMLTPYQLGQLSGRVREAYQAVEANERPAWLADHAVVLGILAAASTSLPVLDRPVFAVLAAEDGQGPQDVVAPSLQAAADGIMLVRANAPLATEVEPWHIVVWFPPGTAVDMSGSLGEAAGTVLGVKRPVRYDHLLALPDFYLSGTALVSIHPPAPNG